MGQWIKDKVSGFFGGIVDGVKGLLGINSPSRVFMGIGDNMALGLGEGFENEMSTVEKRMEKALPTDLDLSSSLSVLPDISGAEAALRNAVTSADMRTGGAFGHPFGEIIVRLDAVTTILSGILNLSDKQIVLNNGVLVGELAPEMETALGNLARMQGR